jgi:hypothetical protein
MAVFGAIALLVTIIALRLRSPLKRGDLRYGPLMWSMVVMSLVLALLPVVITLLGNKEDFWWNAALFLVFGAATIYCVCEALIVRGSYDDEGIRLRSPWTGKKRELWKDLVSADENSLLSWYALTFRTGTTIRLSTNLRGCNDALDKAYEHTRLPSLRPKLRYL